MNLRNHRLLSAIALVGAMLLAIPTGAQAQATMTETENPLDAGFKGVIGMGLIGAELGFVVPALAGASGVWPYIVFPVAGAAGGAVGGYFLLEKGNHTEASVAVLVAGMALVVPALVITVAATAYEPEEELSAEARRMRAAAEAGPGLVRWSERGLLLAPPAVAVGPEGDAKEAFRTGVPRPSGVRMALLSGQF